MTSWVHGEPEVARVEEASRVMFGGSLDGVQEGTLKLLASVVPVVDVPRSELASGIGIVDLLSRTVADSKSAARRLVQQGGAYINNVRIGDLEHKVTTEHLATPTMLVVRGGRKDYRLVRVKD
jgi:tyrosyl-tRNA synthetase